MRILIQQIGTSISVGLDDAQNFSEFAAVVHGVADGLWERAVADAGVGAVEDGYAWISRAFLESNAPEAPEDWLSRLANMVAYAQSKGWVSSDGLSIRAHVEKR